MNKIHAGARSSNSGCAGSLWTGFTAATLNPTLQQAAGTRGPVLRACWDMRCCCQQQLFCHARVAATPPTLHCSASQQASKPATRPPTQPACIHTCKQSHLNRNTALSRDRKKVRDPAKKKLPMLPLRKLNSSDTWLRICSWKCTRKDLIMCL